MIVLTARQTHQYKAPSFTIDCNCLPVNYIAYQKSPKLENYVHGFELFVIK